MDGGRLRRFLNHVVRKWSWSLMGPSCPSERPPDGAPRKLSRAPLPCDNMRLAWLRFTLDD